MHRRLVSYRTVRHHRKQQSVYPCRTSFRGVCDVPRTDKVECDLRLPYFESCSKIQWEIRRQFDCSQIVLTTIHMVIAKILIVSVVALLAFAADTDVACHDFLAALGKKPQKLEYLSCKQKTELQGSPWEAEYRVAGSDAAAIEHYFAKELHIKKLQRTCCVWESAGNTYRDNKHRLFVVSMATEETTFDKREQWEKIPYFYVKVDLYRDDP